jgi:hypothetical protein
MAKSIFVGRSTGRSASLVEFYPYDNNQQPPGRIQI